VSRPTQGPALLIELVNDTLDPGYAAAAKKRGGVPERPAWYARVSTALAAALIGFLLVAAYVHANRGAPRSTKVHNALVQQVRGAQSTGSSLDAQARVLESKVEALRNAALGTATSDDLSRAELLAGTTAAKGPGLQVTLNEAKASATPSAGTRQGSVPITATAVLSDRDVRSVVNQLWSDGAEAISVNDIRLTPTSAIRFAGQAVLVDFQPITAPYVIRAIGAADELDTGFAASEVASRYQTLSAAGKITFTFVEEKSLNLPASAATTLDQAGVPTPTPAAKSATPGASSTAVPTAPQTRSTR
jgi:uncharacterized protein YlxW (UPF0749 family)